jgi:hypothetical protein
MIFQKIKYSLSDLSGPQLGLFLRLLAFALFVIIGLVVALVLIKSGQKYAFEITAKHDLLNFVQIEQAYYAENDEHSADSGDIITGDPEIVSTFSLKNFRPSPGVTIKILSREPFVITSRHKETNKVFRYNFEFGLLTEKTTGESNGEEKTSEEKGELSYQERNTDPDDSD